MAKRSLCACSICRHVIDHPKTWNLDKNLQWLMATHVGQNLFSFTFFPRTWEEITEILYHRTMVFWYVNFQKCRRNLSNHCFWYSFVELQYVTRARHFTSYYSWELRLIKRRRTSQNNHAWGIWPWIMVFRGCRDPDIYDWVHSWKNPFTCSLITLTVKHGFPGLYV